jgi:MFS family permease
VSETRLAPSLSASVVALGIAQIISWGSLFYTIAVLGPALRQAAGVGEVTLHAFYTAGLVVSGLAAPVVGRAIDALGGRRVLSLASVLSAIACVALASVQGPISLLVGWLLAGLAMSAALYDPAFATLHAIAGTSYRRAVTALTLFGGFASTVFWPLSQVLLDGVGVRATYAIYAALHLAVCLPLHVFGLPSHRGGTVAHVSDAHVVPPDARATFAWLAAALAIASFTASALSAHLIGLLTSAGLTTKDAVLIGALIGPMQVAGRVMEFAAGRQVKPIAVGVIAFGTLAVALAMFWWMETSFALAAVFACLYGWSNGVLTIVRGTVPAELFGRDRYGALLGLLAKPQFISRAVAPAVLAGLLVVDPGRQLTLGTMAILGVIAWLAYVRAVRGTPRR